MKKPVAKKAEKYVTEKTFEKVMESVAKTLSNQDKVMSHISTTLGEMKQDIKEIKTGLTTLEMAVLSHERKIENILVRVEKLESKVK